MPVRIKSLGQLRRLLKGVAPRGGGKSSRRRRTSTISEPQRRLWEAVKSRYPNAEQDKRGLIAGRRYIADILIAEYGLVIEVDGWEFHGKYKSGFQRDREKDRAFMIAGYRICRFSAGEILRDVEGVLETLEQVIGKIRDEKK
ncbi:MAG: DUF559 domain-containing protein [Gammaproteobacteria bacterium]|nr:MAG: DUF559 domain-containing protein [Gammaproteobacteria bacterium]